jgi:effector-binding domain-containing protein
MTSEATPEIVEVPETTTAVVRGTVAMSDLADFFDSSFGVLSEALAKQGATATGAAYALYRGVPDESATLEVGFPVDRMIEPDGSAEAGSLPGGRVARVVHAGSFDGLGDAWQRLGSWIGDL